MTGFAQARLDMFESGLFGQGDAFWRWIDTDDAQPYLDAFVANRAPAYDGEFFMVDFTAEDLLDPERLAALAVRIEATFS